MEPGPQPQAPGLHECEEGRDPQQRGQGSAAAAGSRIPPAPADGGGYRWGRAGVAPDAEQPIQQAQQHHGEQARDDQDGGRDHEQAPHLRVAVAHLGRPDQPQPDNEEDGDDVPQAGQAGGNAARHRISPPAR